MCRNIPLSHQGSNRATAYAMSNKILRREDRLYVGWLDGPATPGGPERIRLGVCDATTGEVVNTLLLGEGIDNHCGPAIALDGTGRMHAIVGAHSGDFLYRWSDDPGDLANWSAPEAMGPHDTYPGLVVDAEDTLHLLSRESGAHPRRLVYRRKRADAPWETPVGIALSPRPGYTHFMHCLSVGPSGRLHATFQYYYADEGLHADCAAGRLAAYIFSDDGGNSWQQDAGPAVLPLTLETTQAFRRAPAGGIRLSNHVVDSQDRVWVGCSVPEQPGWVLLRRDRQGWTEINTSESLDVLNNSGGREMSLSREPGGLIHLVVGSVPAGVAALWSDPRHDLFHLALDESGKQAVFRQMTHTDSEGASWLPSLENWNWSHPSCQDGPWMLFTRAKSGEAGKPNPTDVFLTRLDAHAKGS